MEPNEFPKFFRLTPTERKASLSMLGLILLMIIIFQLIQHYYNPKIELSEIQKSYLKNELKQAAIYTTSPITQNKLKLTNFNPNNVTYKKLITMGINEYAAKSLINYRNKGAQYSRKSDLKKIYGIDSTLYAAIEPFISIPAVTSTVPKKSVEKQKPKSNTAIRAFNPNNVNSQDLMAMGIPAYFSKNLEKYTLKGGIIRKTEDLYKIYGMTDSLYEKIEPFVTIELDSNYKSNVYSKIESPPPISINLNIADTSKLPHLKGIGSKRAELIIKYRTNLGGFYSPDQLKEIWSIDQEVYDQISTFIYVDDSYKRIDVKETEFSELLRHKYFDYNMTKMVKNYFAKKDQSTFLDQFVASSPLDSAKLSKALPYLKLKVD